MSRTGGNATRPGDVVLEPGTIQPVAAGRIARLLAAHPLVSFFAIAYVVSWTYVLAFLVLWTLPDTFITNTPELLGPFAAALVMTAVISGRDGVRHLLGRLVRWRVAPRWYAFALVGVPLVYLAGVALVPGALVPMVVPSASTLTLYPVLFVVFALLYGPVLEEVGWRGFALPLLQGRYGPVLGSIVLGSLWALWHLPQYLTPSFAKENGGSAATGGLVFLLAAVSISVIITWVFNQTGGSLLIAVLLHNSVNFSQAVTSDVFPSAGFGEVGPTIAYTVLALILVVATRGRLGLPIRAPRTAHEDNEDRPDLEEHAGRGTAGSPPSAHGLAGHPAGSAGPAGRDTPAPSKEKR